MSRSYKKTAVIGMTGARTEKWDKQHANRRLRRIVNSFINNHIFHPLPLLREISNVWSFNKDGKRWLLADEIPKYLRK